MRLRHLFVAVIALCASFAGASVANAQCSNNGTVTNTNDSGAGSLRAAMEQVNACAGQGSIDFAIPGTGPHQINVDIVLPTIVQPVLIDGWSQPGSSKNTGGLFEATNAVPMIEVTGSEVAQVGFVNSCADGETKATEIRGLVINGFTSVGIYNTRCDGISINGNFIGTDPTGSFPSPFGSPAYGIVLFDGANNAVGGSASQRNVISGHSGVGVLINGASTNAAFATNDNYVMNNFIGTDASGSRSISSGEQFSGTGVFVFGAGAAPPDGSTTGPYNTVIYNIISGHTGDGVWLSGESSDTRVTLNGIGTDVRIFDTLQALIAEETVPDPPSQIAGMGNGGAGIRVGDSSGRTQAEPVADVPSNSNQIAGNASLYNDGAGIHVEAGQFQKLSLNALSGNQGDGISLVSELCPLGMTCGEPSAHYDRNAIHDNGGLGIDAQPDGAGDSNDWWITLSEPIDNVYTVTNPFPTYSCEVQFFANASCDASGNGEGREYLGNYTSDPCPATFTFTPAAAPTVGTQVTAVYSLIQNLGDTSITVSLEFTPCVGELENEDMCFPIKTMNGKTAVICL